MTKITLILIALLTLVVSGTANAGIRIIIEPPAVLACQLDNNQPIYDDGQAMPVTRLGPRENLELAKLAHAWSGYKWDFETARVVAVTLPAGTELLVDTRTGEPRYLVARSERLFPATCVKQQKK